MIAFPLGKDVAGNTGKGCTGGRYLNKEKRLTVSEARQWMHGEALLDVSCCAVASTCVTSKMIDKRASRW